MVKFNAVTLWIKVNKNQYIKVKIVLFTEKNELQMNFFHL